MPKKKKKKSHEQEERNQFGTLEKKFILLDITNLTGNLHTIPLTNFRCSSKQKVFFVHKSVNSVISHEMGHLIFSFLFVGIIEVKKEQESI